MYFAFLTLRIVLGALVDRFGNDERRLHRQAPRAADQIVPVQEPESVVESLLAHVRQDFRLRWEQDPGESVNVLLRQFDARIRNVDL